MKRKIGELRNIPIVEGDRNLVRGGAEIHINDLQTNSSSSEGSSKYAPRYYAIDWSKCSVDWAVVMNGHESNNVVNYSYCLPASYKINIMDGINIIISHGNYFKMNLNHYTIIAFSYIPICVSTMINNDVENIRIDTFEDVIQNLNTKLDLSMEGITEITEEEYYKMD